MKLGDVTEVGFYKEVNGEDIWECFENTDRDEEWRKDFPLLLDSWLYQYTDENDRKVYECDGLLYKIGYDYPDLEVEKITDIEYEVIAEFGTTLIEKKPTYKERYLELKKYLDTQRPTGICETCTERANEEADKLWKEIKELKRYKFLFEKCREFYLRAQDSVKELLNDNEDLKDSLKRTVCQAECFKHKEAEKHKALLNEVVMYCEDQDLKNDFTAVAILEMLEGGVK